MRNLVTCVTGWRKCEGGSYMQITRVNKYFSMCAPCVCMYVSLLIRKRDTVCTGQGRGVLLSKLRKLYSHRCTHVGTTKYWLERHCTVSGRGGRRCGKIFCGVGHSDKFVLATNELWGPDYCPLRWRVRLRNECGGWGKEVEAMRAHTHAHTICSEALLLVYSLPCRCCCCCCHLLTFKALINVVYCGMWHVGTFRMGYDDLKAGNTQLSARIWAHSSVPGLRHVRN